MSNHEAWNDAVHVDRVNSDHYTAQTHDVFAPQIACYLPEATEAIAVLHDLGGYDGKLINDLLRHHVTGRWRGGVTDATIPPHIASNEAISFFQTPGHQIARVLGHGSVAATVSCNRLHLLPDDELDEAIHAIGRTSQPGAPVVTIIPHLVTHRVAWSDFAGMDSAQLQDRRGVFVDDYRPDRVASHAFLDGVRSYPRTVESFMARFALHGLRLMDTKGLHLPEAVAPPHRHRRYYDTLQFLPTYPLTAWRVES